jgi:hypothetical protein
MESNQKKAEKHQSNPTITQISPYLTEIRYIASKQPFSGSILLCSDVHFDNPKCNRSLFFKHLDQAKERNALVIDNGDFFCLMEGKGDRRHSKSNIRPEYNKSNYIDLVIGDAAEKLAEYGDIFAVLGEGNHETAIRRHLETDPTGRLVGLLKYKYGCENVTKQGYQGFVKVVFQYPDGGMVRSCLIYRHHGKWGGVVSKGTQSTARFASIVPDADVVIRGHNHESWIMEQPRYKLKNNGELIVSPQWHVNTPTYKEEFVSTGGFAVERIVTPKAMGGYWLNFHYKRDGVDISFEKVQ